MPWAVNHDQRPMAVLEAHDADDVQAAVRWAVQHEVQVTVQPTGHGTTGAFEHMLLVRTAALKGIAIDLERRTATVGGGRPGRRPARRARRHRPDLPRRLQLRPERGRDDRAGRDQLVRPRVRRRRGQHRVDRDGRRDGPAAPRRRDRDPELFWALRGSGGDFGIITRLELALHPAPAVYGGRLLWPVEQMGQVLRAFRAVTESAPEELSVWYHTYQFPPFPEIPEPIRGKAFASVAVAYLGSARGRRGRARAVPRDPGMVMDLLGEVPLAALGSIADEPTDPTPGLEMSRLLERIDDDLIDRLEEAVGAGSASPLAVFQIRHLGGAFAVTPAGAGSHGPVTESYNLHAVGVPAVPESSR